MGLIGMKQTYIYKYGNDAIEATVIVLDVCCLSFKPYICRHKCTKKNLINHKIVAVEMSVVIESDVKVTRAMTRHQWSKFKCPALRLAWARRMAAALARL